MSLQLDLWSDSSDVGWGAHLGEDVASGLWSLEEAELSINARELLAVEFSLRFFLRRFRTPRWRCLQTTPQRYRTLATKEALDCLSSTT